MSDIGRFSSRQQVASAVSNLQDSLGGSSTVASDITSLKASRTTDEANIALLKSDQAVVAGPTALTDAKFLTKAVLRKTLAVAAGPNASTVNTAHGITSPVAIIGVIVQLTNGTAHLCFGQGGMLADTLAHSITVAIAGANVGLTSGAGGDYSAYAGSIILLYTLS